MIYKELSPAKLNLFLYVTGKRDDGFHDLCSLMVLIDLCDELEFSFGNEKISIQCDHPDVPEDESNLAYRAAKIFFDRMQKKKTLYGQKGFSIKISKNIPIGGGLGGGSSNAACVLKFLNRFYKKPFSKEELIQMGLALGADVPFFIFESPALAKGIGEKLEKCRFLKPFYALVCDPGISASTAKVYENLDLTLTLQEKYNIKKSLNICFRGQEFDVREHLHNDLEVSACRLYPEIKTVKEEMELLLCEKVFMTGSGSSLFALFPEYQRASKAFDNLSKLWKMSKKKLFLSSLKINI